MYPLHKIFLVLVAALMLTGLLALAPVNALAATCTEWHVVRKGESLDTISRDYGISRAELVALNKLSNPRRVFSGQRLCLDTGGNTSSTYHYQKPGVPPSARFDPKSKYYTPYYHDSDSTYYYPPKYGYESQYYYDNDWDCDRWYDQDKCFNYEKTKKYDYQHDDKKYEYNYPSDCDCYDWYDDDWKTRHEYDCNCKDDDKHGYSQDYHRYYYSDDAAIRDWNFSVVRVREDRDVTIQANSFPHDSTFQVEIRYDGGPWIYSDQLNSGGSFKATVPIPHQLRGYSPLIIRVTKYPDAITDLETFTNYSYTESSRSAKTFAKFEYQYKHEYEGIPTIRIENVLRDKTVSIQTHNFPAHLEFNVYMGEMGTKGKGGYYAGDFYSGPGGAFFVTIAIPSQLKGEAKIAIRTESTEKGYYSYNWFNNKTAY
ncbi:LysM domain-containing protein [Chloroflexota bacterium]